MQANAIWRKTMSVNLGEKTKQPDRVAALLHQATKQVEETLRPAMKRLEEILGLSAGAITAEWSQDQDDRGRISFALKISDFVSEAAGTFTIPELASPQRLRGRLLE